MSLMIDQIPRIKCQCLPGSQDAATLDNSMVLEGIDYVALCLSVKQGKFLVGTETFPELAHMNSKAALVLFEAQKYAGVQLDLYVKRNDLEECKRKVDKAGSPRFLHIDAHMSGRKSDSESIGALLSKHSVYLQDPHNPVTSMEYCNPHVLPLVVSDVEVWFQEIEFHRSQAKDTTEWNAALDTLPHEHHFDAAAVSVDDTIVITPMMP
jgi:hypothetical protein